MCDFTRKSVIQAHDTFSSKADLSELDAEIRSQKVPGELVISYPGNGGRTSVVFKGRAVVHRGEVETLPESS
jgi:hypothetical protein